jgi:predicted  nucleic acid-binding Zn-ribbon protein
MDIDYEIEGLENEGDELEKECSRLDYEIEQLTKKLVEKECRLEVIAKQINAFESPL